MNNFSNLDKNNILNLNIKEMRKLIISGDISSEELVNIHIDQINKFDSKTNAVCTFTPDFALNIAREQDKSKKFDQPLSGIPILIKDLNKTEGIRTTMGSRIYSDFIPKEDDLVVKKIKDANFIKSKIRGLGFYALAARMVAQSHKRLLTTALFVEFIPVSCLSAKL